MVLVLAGIGAVILVIAFLPLLIVGAIATLAVVAIVDNVRELRA